MTAVPWATTVECSTCGDPVEPALAYWFASDRDGFYTAACEACVDRLHRAHVHSFLVEHGDEIRDLLDDDDAELFASVLDNTRPSAAAMQAHAAPFN